MAQKSSQRSVLKLSRRVLRIVKGYRANVAGAITVRRVIVFGSAARGNMKRGSDIDVIILSPDFKRVSFPDRLLLLTRLRMGESRRVAMDILGYTPEEFVALSQNTLLLSEAKREGVTVT